MLSEGTATELHLRAPDALLPARETSGARKWTGVALLHLMIAAIGTTSTAKGVFFPALVQEFGLTHAAGAALLSVSSVVAGVIALLTAWLVVRTTKVNRLIAIVTFIAGLGFVAAGAAHTYRQLLLAYVLMSGQTVNMVAIAFLLTHWFKTRRGLAIAAVYSGTMTGGVLFTPLLSYVVVHFGWRSGYQAVAAILLLLPILILRVIKLEPGRPQQREAAGAGASGAPLPGLTVREALATRSLWLTVFAYFVFGANTGTYFVHFISLLGSVGYTPARAALTMSQLFLLAGLAKVIFGYLGDRIDVRAALALALGLAALGWCVLIWFDTGQMSLYAFTLIFGLSYSGPLVLIPLLVATTFGYLTVWGRGQWNRFPIGCNRKTGT